MTSILTLHSGRGRKTTVEEVQTSIYLYFFFNYCTPHFQALLKNTARKICHRRRWENLSSSKHANMDTII